MILRPDGVIIIPEQFFAVWYAVTLAGLMLGLIGLAIVKQWRRP